MEAFSTVTGSALLASLDSHIAVDPAQLQALFRRGTAYAMQGRYKQAQQVFTLLIVHDMSNPHYHLALGASFQGQNRFSEAIMAYGMAWAQEPGDELPLFFMGEALVQQGKESDARVVLHLFLRKSEERCRYGEQRTRARRLLMGARERRLGDKENVNGK